MSQELISKAEHQGVANGGTFLKPDVYSPGVEPGTVIDLGLIKIADSTMMLILTSIIVLSIVYLSNRRKNIIPEGLQNFFEFLYETLENFFAGLVGNKDKVKGVLPVLGSVIIFIGLSNLMGLLPVLTSITYNGHHVFRGATSDFNTTFALALGSIIVLQFIGFKENGISYLGHFFKFKEVYRGFKKGIGDGFIAIVEFFVGLLEFIGEFIRIISLSVRLFGNMFAGKVVMSILIGMFAYLLPALWLGFELLVAFVQALVFTSLVAVYYSMVLKKEDH